MQQVKGYQTALTAISDCHGLENKSFNIKITGYYLRYHWSWWQSTEHDLKYSYTLWGLLYLKRIRMCEINHLNPEMIQELCDWPCTDSILPNFVVIISELSDDANHCRLKYSKSGFPGIILGERYEIYFMSLNIRWPWLTDLHLLTWIQCQSSNFRSLNRQSNPSL